MAWFRTRGKEAYWRYTAAPSGTLYVFEVRFSPLVKTTVAVPVEVADGRDQEHFRRKWDAFEEVEVVDEDEVDEATDIIVLDGPEDDVPPIALRPVEPALPTAEETDVRRPVPSDEASVKVPVEKLRIAPKKTRQIKRRAEATDRDRSAAAPRRRRVPGRSE